VCRDGYRFDTGPSLLLFPDEYRKTFEWLGSSLEEHVQLAKIEPAAYRVFFADAYSSNNSSSPSTSSSSGSGRSSSSSSSSSSSGGNASSSSGSSSNEGGSYLDLLYDVNAMVQQLERLQEGAGEHGQRPPYSFKPAFASLQVACLCCSLPCWTAAEGTDMLLTLAASCTDYSNCVV
jgi:phytoene dehydrogenase-like protein